MVESQYIELTLKRTSFACTLGIGGYGWDRPRLLPAVLAVPDAARHDGVAFAESSLRVERRADEGRLPPPEAPGLPPSLTSLRACAPKLTRLANDGEEGGFDAVSSSSRTAGSSPKLFLNSGELETEEEARLARRCRPNAGKGDGLAFGFLVNPRAVIEVPLRCWTEGVVGTAAEGGDEDTTEGLLFARGLNISTKDDRRRRSGIEGEGGGFSTDILMAWQG